MTKPSKLSGGNLPAGSPESAEIEVTPEMIEAGVSVLWELRGNVGSEELVKEVYWAMRSRAPQTLSERAAVTAHRRC